MLVDHLMYHLALAASTFSGFISC